MSLLDFNAEYSRGRQNRLLAAMQQMRLDLAIVQAIEHVQWLTGARYPATMSPAAVLRADGHLTLVAPKKPILEAAAHEIVNYDAQWHSTLRNDQRQAKLPRRRAAAEHAHVDHHAQRACTVRRSGSTVSHH